MSDLAAVAEAVAKVEAAEKTCPANSRRGLSGKVCPKCGAGPSETCGPATQAAFDTVTAVRAYLTEQSK